MKIPGFILLAATAIAFMLAGCSQPEERPNVVMIITDDQGYGDLGVTGNPHVKTPNIDRFATENTQFTNFYVSPVCAPTRSSLMTGRYSLRTGITDTYNGGAIMSTAEVTIAEMLKQAGYTSGMFGKWHLGDNYPSRPSDQGFDETLMHLAGGMGQVGDFTNYFDGDSSYFDPVLWHNNKRKSYQGYCSDIFTDEAIKFIEANKDNPFFCYLSYNAPHVPLQVPDKYYQLYKDIDPSSGFEQDNRPFYKMSERDKEMARKVYAMVTNIDDNVGKVLQKLDELKLAGNTLVIFMTDNGPQHTRYLAGMQGLKSDVYRGGIRVPFFLRYPALPGAPSKIETPSAHLDVLPTLARICKVDLPADRKIDGKSLLPLLQGKEVEWAGRPFFSYWTRKHPELYNNISLEQGSFKLVGMNDYNDAVDEFQLFNIETDPYERNNITAQHTGIAKEYKQLMDEIRMELIQSPNIIDPPRIMVGIEHENPVFLNRNDAGGERAIWAQEEIYGKWRTHIQEGTYNIRFKFINPVAGNGTMYLETGPIIHRKKYNQSTTDILEMPGVSLPEMDCDIIPFYRVNGRRIFPFWAAFERVD